MRVAVAVAMALVLMARAGGASRAQSAAPEPEGYRLEDYGAPTPATLGGAKVISTRDAAELWKQGGAAFVDVLPQTPKPANLPRDVIWRDKPRHDIPGSLWLPDTGYGELAPSMSAYFAAGLAKATANDQTKTIVFYCRRQCWMSWNAAKRALALGYVSVDWFPDGVDGWSENGLPLELRQPEPRP